MKKLKTQTEILIGHLQNKIFREKVEECAKSVMSKAEGWFYGDIDDDDEAFRWLVGDWPNSIEFLERLSKSFSRLLLLRLMNLTMPLKYILWPMMKEYIMNLILYMKIS